jgi:hypothetical protein
MAIECNKLTGIKVSKCNQSKVHGGVPKVYIGIYENLTSKSLNVNNVVTGITLSASTYIYEFSGSRNTFQFTNTLVPSQEAGPTYTPSIMMKFTKMDSDKLNSLRYLSINKLFAIVVTESGEEFLVGSDSGLELAESVGDSGVIMTDVNNMTINLSGMETQPPYSISSSTVYSSYIAV